MSMSKWKLAVVVLAAVGLAGSGLGWWETRPGKGGTTVAHQAIAADPDREPRPRAARGDRRSRDAQLVEARKQLTRIEEDAEEADRKWSAQIVDARQQLVELEEKLAGAPVAGAVETRLATEERNIQRYLATGFTPDHPSIVAARAKVAVLKKELATSGRLALRKKMIRLEEDIRLLRRKQAEQREQGRRKRDAADERVRQLETGTAAAAPERSLRGVENRLEAIQREIEELRQEVRRLRTERKR
jgi:hypothetical protein